MDKIYTQEDMDNITSKVKESTIAKYEKTHISIDAYNELESKYNDLINQNKINDIKQIFINKNGNENAFNDFINTNKELLNLDVDNISNSIDELSKSKQWYFNDVPKVKNEDEITNSLLRGDNHDIIDGTIIRKSYYTKT